MLLESLDSTLVWLKSIRHKFWVDSSSVYNTCPIASNLCFSLEKFMSETAMMLPFFPAFLLPLWRSLYSRLSSQFAFWSCLGPTTGWLGAGMAFLIFIMLCWVGGCRPHLESDWYFTYWWCFHSDEISVLLWWNYCSVWKRKVTRHTQEQKDHNNNCSAPK